MFGSEIEERLRRLFVGPKAVHPEHARELEGQLLARFDQRYPRKERIFMNSFFIRRALVCSAVAGVLGVVACTAPVDLDVEVGRTVSIRYDPEGAAQPSPADVAEFLRAATEAPKEPGEAAGKERHAVSVRVRKEPGAASIDAEIWGRGRMEEPLTERIKAAFPALKDAQIKEELLQGKVRGTLAKKLGHDVLDLDVLDTADEETARQQVMAQLLARGVKGTVQVEVKGDSGERRVKIKVEQEECEPDAAAPSTQETSP